MSASKAWNLAGLKAAAGGRRTRGGRRSARVPEEVGHGCSHLGVIAHTAAFQDGGPWLDALLPASPTTAGCSPSCWPSTCPRSADPPQGTYLAWLDCRAALGSTRPRPSSTGAGSP